MAAPKLSKEQRALLISRLASGETYAAIMKEFGCSWENVHYHARENAQEISERWEQYKAGLVGRGLRDRNKRIERLQWVASKLEEELENQGLYYNEMKVASTGQTVESPVFNHPLIDKYLKVQEQIAKELGDWVEKKEVTGKDGQPLSTVVILPSNGRDSAT